MFINKFTGDAYDDTDNVGAPIIDVCTTVGTCLDKLNDTAKYACRDEDGKQAQTFVRANGNTSAAKAIR